MLIAIYFVSHKVRRILIKIQIDIELLETNSRAWKFEEIKQFNIEKT